MMNAESRGAAEDVAPTPEPLRCRAAAQVLSKLFPNFVTPKLGGKSAAITVMTWLVPAIHVDVQGASAWGKRDRSRPNRRREPMARRSRADVDDRDKPGHDGSAVGMAPTLEIPNFCLESPNISKEFFGRLECFQHALDRSQNRNTS
jgi:hypothetical protein